MILSNEQQKIVDLWLQKPGPMVVRAGAGSGKTRVLTACVKGLLEQSDLKTRILCLTFTNKAADEMKSRLSKIPGVNEKTFIGTIHSFGLEVIRAYRHELGYEEMPHIIDRESDRKQILADLFLENASLRSFFLNPNSGDTISKHQSKMLHAAHELIATSKRRLIVNPEENNEDASWTEHRKFIFQEYNQRLRNQNLIDFEDILVLAWRIFTESPGVARIYQRLYKHILVDEAQDLNFAQYSLLRALAGESTRNIFFVGDDKQTIHGYAEASKDYMLKYFLADYNVPEDRILEIKHNYRSSKAVIEAANLIMPGSASTDDSFFEGLVETRHFKTEEDEAKWVISKIHELLALQDSEDFEGKITLDKVAILARNKWVFTNLMKLLDQDESLKGRYYVKKGVDQLEPVSTYMQVFGLGTRLLINKQGTIYQNQLKQLLGLDHVATNGHRGIEFLKELVSLTPQVNGILQAEISTLFSSWERILDLPPIRIWDLLRESISSITNEDERHLAGLDLNEWEAAWKTYIRSVPQASISFADFRRFVAIGQNFSSPQGILTLSTVHAVKGLEFHAVFLIGMGEGTFPDYRSLRGQALIEEKNNAYVAITRAKRHLYISYPSTKLMPWGGTKPQPISQFLKDFEVIESSSVDVPS